MPDAVSSSEQLTLRSASLPGDGDDIARLCWAYRDVLVERTARFSGIVEAYYGADDYADLIARLPEIHARPRGDILLAQIGGNIVGCSMYYPLATPGLVEIKRVFVDPSARGSGAGYALVTETLRRAKQDGYDRMVLDTMVDLTEAITLYRRLGFAPAEPFYDLDPRFADAIRFFGCDL